MSLDPVNPPVQPYVPPKQSGLGQAFDAALLLVLLLAVLFGVTYLIESGSSNDVDEVKPIAELPITDGEKAAYQKLIDQEVVDLEGANIEVATHRSRPGSEQYPIDALPLIATLATIAIYLAFVFRMSFKEYREVIYEKFGPPSNKTGSQRKGGAS